MMQLLNFSIVIKHISYVHLSSSKQELLLKQILFICFFQYRISLNIYYLNIDKTFDKRGPCPSVHRKLSSLRVVRMNAVLAISYAGRYFASEFNFLY